jgi:hypothetical protein
LILSFSKHAAINAIGAETIADKEKAFPSNDGQSMEVVDANASENLFQCLRSFDYGKSFGGSFTVFNSTDTKEKVQEHIRRHMHLFNQIVLNHAELLPFMMDIYAVCEFVCKRDGSDTAIAGQIFVESPNYVKADLVKDMLTVEIATIIPVLLQNLSSEDLIDLVTCADAFAKGMVVQVISVMFKEDRIPPSRAVMDKVRVFAEKYDDSFKRECFIPIIGGFATEEVESLLPGYVKMYGSPEGLSDLEKIFNRLIKARPPPLSKAGLLIALHR